MNFITDIVKEKGITSLINQYKKSFELEEKIKEHSEKFRHIHNSIRRRGGMDLYIGMDNSIDEVSYDLEPIHNKYSQEIFNNVYEQYNEKVFELYEQYMNIFEADDMEDCNHFVVYINNDYEIEIYSDDIDINEYFNRQETEEVIECTGFPYNPVTCECYCEYCQ
jgi:uncharacterized protein YicC (UPF0701 family)